MQIYIGNLSPQITCFDLGQLLKVSKGCPSFKFNSYQKDHRQYFYALTSIEPEILANRVIEKHNLKQVKDRVIQLHAYKDRSVLNERRAFGWGRKSWFFEERRKADRRAA